MPSSEMSHRLAWHRKISTVRRSIRQRFAFETNGELSYLIPNLELQLSVFVRHNDKLITYYQEFDDDNNAITGQLIQDGFTLSDVSLSKHFWKKHIQLVAGIQNVFDVDNAALNGIVGGMHSGGAGSSSVGLGRNYFLRVSWQFGWGE